METTQESIRKNIQFYDRVYSHVKVHRIVDKVLNLRKFLDEATKTDTSWHGLYQGNFADRIRNKRVFEIGSGDGLNALVMAALGADVIANDISNESEKIIREAASKLGLTNVQPVSGNFTDLALESHSFDFVVGKSFLHHLTHEVEKEYLHRIALLLKADGEARFLEPATNSQLLDKLRWMLPTPGRPSILNQRAFAKFRNHSPHPDRDNSSEHFIQVGKRFFNRSEILPIGSIERFCRLVPQGEFNRRFRRWAHRLETRLPMWFRRKAARSQLIVYQCPHQ